MCFSIFSKVLIGDERMVLCRKTDLPGANIQKIIKKAFPELFAELNFLGKKFKKVEYTIECCRKMYSSRFDSQVNDLEKNHDWDKCPFMA